MGKALGADYCIRGVDVVWMGLHGFGITLVLLIAAMEFLDANSFAAVVAAAGSYVFSLADLADHKLLQEWLPLLSSVAAVGAIAHGGSRVAKGQSFFTDALSKGPTHLCSPAAVGAFPYIFTAVLGGHVAASYQQLALPKTATIEEWIPLLVSAAGVGMLAQGAKRYASGNSFFAPSVMGGAAPRLGFIGLGVLVFVSFITALEDKTGGWPQWIGLLVAAAAAGLVAKGGVRHARGQPFVDPSLAEGPVPVAVMAILAAFTLSGFDSVTKEGGKAPVDFLPVVGAASAAALVATGGSRFGKGRPFLPDLLANGPFPLVFTLFLAAYTIVSLHGFTSKQQGGLTVWMNLFGAATVFAGVAVLGARLNKAD